MGFNNRMYTIGHNMHSNLTSRRKVINLRQSLFPNEYPTYEPLPTINILLSLTGCTKAKTAESAVKIRRLVFVNASRTCFRMWGSAARARLFQRSFGDVKSFDVSQWIIAPAAPTGSATARAAAITLPEEVRGPIGDAVLDELADRGLVRRRFAVPMPAG
jgi:hypothetical protein